MQKARPNQGPMLLVLGQGPCPKSLKLYTKLKPGSGTALSDFVVCFQAMQILGQTRSNALGPWPGPCPKSLKLYSKFKPGSGTALSDSIYAKLDLPNGPKWKKIWESCATSWLGLWMELKGLEPWPWTLVQTWSKLCPNLNQKLVQGLYKAGPMLVQSWSKIDPKLV